MIVYREELLGFPAVGAVLTSYTLSPTLFDGRLARPLRDNRCETLILLVDRLGYDAAIAERGALMGAGTSYWIVPVDHTGAFHPKVALLWSNDEVRLYVSSANLSYGGLGQNLELIDRIVCKRAEPGPIEVVASALDWLEALASTFALAPRPADRLREAVDEVRQLIASFPCAASKGGHPRFLHNLDEPLLDQLGRLLAEEVVDVMAAAPFHDRDLATARALCGTFPKANVRLAQACGATAISKAVGERLKRLTPGILQAKTKEDQRPLHGKVLCLKGKESATLVVGSANITRAALSTTVHDGNCEAVICRSAYASATEFDPLLENEVVFSALRWDKVGELAPLPRKNRDPHPRIVWAEIDGRRIEIRFRALDPRDTAALRDVALRTGGGRRADLARHSARWDGATFILQLDIPPELSEELEEPAVVEAEARCSPKAPYVIARALIVSPELVDSTTAQRRVRSAMRKLDRGEATDEDLGDIIDYTQRCLAGLLLSDMSQEAAGSGGHAKERPEENDDTPGAVTNLKPGEEPPLHRTAAPGGGMDILDALPGVFTRLLSAQDTRAVDLEIEEEAEDEEEESTRARGAGRKSASPPPANKDREGGEPPGDRRHTHILKCLDFAKQTLGARPLLKTEGAADALVRLFDLALVFARYEYLGRAPIPSPSDPRSTEYQHVTQDILDRALSISGQLSDAARGALLYAAAQFPAAVTRALSRDGVSARVLLHIAELADPETNKSLQRMLASAWRGFSRLQQDAKRPTGAEYDDDKILEMMLLQPANILLPTAKPADVRLRCAALAPLADEADRAVSSFIQLLKLQSIIEARMSKHKQLAALNQEISSREVAISKYANNRNKNCRRLREEVEALRPEKQEVERSLQVLDKQATALRETLAQVDAVRDPLTRLEMMERRGQWRTVVVPLSVLRSEICPKCQLSLAAEAARRLVDVTICHTCSSCGIWIVPVLLPTT